MLAAALAALTLTAPSPQATLPLHPCTVQSGVARCGTLTVPENRAKPNGRTIGLHIVVIPAAKKPVRPDAFTYLSGGPGGASASEMSLLSLLIWPGVHEHHDILLVDQRGTGGSNKIECPTPTDALDTDDRRKAYIEKCIATLKVDSTQYGTKQAMDDLDGVRAALGYRTLDVYGTSYGATAAQVYLERHPRSVRTMILDGATFLDVPFYSHFAANGQRALDNVAQGCAAQPTCARAFPHWRRTLASLIAAWNAKPMKISSDVTLTGDDLANVVQQMLLIADSARYIPLTINTAAAGDYEQLSHYVGSGEMTRSLMYWTIWCNEPWVGLGSRGLGSRGPWHSFLDGATKTTLATNAAVCRYVPKSTDRAPASWPRPHSKAPVLLLAGGADPQDPVANVPGFRQAFPNGRMIVAPGQGHAVGQFGCLGAVVAAFVDSGTTKHLDTSCIKDIHRPAYAVS